MSGQLHPEQLSQLAGGRNHRERLLAGIPVTERRLQLAGVSTAVLEGGSGPPVVLLHGPGEFAGKWMRVIPDLVMTHRVIAPDLARIAVPTTLIWGRHARAIRLRIAEAASARYGWPLHVVENCADDPPRDQPEAFLEALHVALGTSTRQEVAV